MDAFWGITLSVIAISWFWKRERIKQEDKRYIKSKQDEDIEKEKQRQVIEHYAPIFAGPMTKEEKAELAAKNKAEKERTEEEARLRKQGYTDELIAVILPTINNGQ